MTPLEESFLAPVTEHKTFTLLSALNTPMKAKTNASLNSISILSGIIIFIESPNFSCNVFIKKVLNAPPPVTSIELSFLECIYELQLLVDRKYDV